MIKQLSLVKAFALLPILVSCLLTSMPLVANEKVTLQLKWFHQFQFAGYYAAKEKGFFAEEGLDVEIRERDPNKTPSEAVLSGSADFGVADTSLVLHRLQGKPLVVLAAIFQHSPLALMTLKESGIISPLELKGKRVMFQRNVDDAALTATFSEFGLKHDDIKHIPHNFKDDALLNSPIDAMAVYLTNQPFYYKKKNIEVSIISPNSYGIDFYGDMLFTSESYLKNNTETALAFRRASLRGWEYAMENPEQVIHWILTRYGSQKTREHLKFEAEMTRRMIQPDLIELGHINNNRFNRIANIYKNQQLISEENYFQGLSYLDHINKESPNSKWLIFIGTALILCLVVMALFIAVNQRLKSLVKIRTLELERSQAELEKLSNTDALTGLGNRRNLDKFLSQQIKECDRYNKSLSVILFDIDHFKRINDNLGHNTGDQTLATLANLVSNNVRSTDMLGRWGGEEFMLICPHTEVAGATRLAELLRRAIATHDFSIQLAIRCSFGVAQLQPKETAAELFNRTDLALYQAKRAGRNLVVTADKEHSKKITAA